jgi:hypothetical protein
MFPRLKKLLVGSPLRTTDLPHQRLSKKAALAVFASDNLSSSAYATEEILLALVIGGSAALHLMLPAAIGIAVLTAIVVISYSQTIHAYPQRGRRLHRGQGEPRGHAWLGGGRRAVD